MSSRISASGIVNQRLFGARGLSMRGETIRRDLHDGWPGTRPRHSTGPPQETFAHATPCRKTAYARRKTRTPRPCGRGVHSEPFGEPLSRSPLEVGRAKQVSNSRVGFRFTEGTRYRSDVLETGFRIAWRDRDTHETGPAVVVSGRFARARALSDAEMRLLSGAVGRC